MNIINIVELLKVVPDLINLFLSGFIFMTIYNWMNNKSKQDFSVIALWSISISFIITNFYSWVHSFIFSSTDINDGLKVIVYCLSAIVVAIAVTKLKSTKLIAYVLHKTNYKSGNDDVFDDIIDYDKGTTMQVYLKSSKAMYVGQFLYREEKGLDSWIVLVTYTSLSTEDYHVMFCPTDDNYKSTVMINLRDIDRIELIYKDDSDVWKRFMRETIDENKCGSIDETNMEEKSKSKKCYNAPRASEIIKLVEGCTTTKDDE